jgi:putative ABC transport system permease protein
MADIPLWRRYLRLFGTDIAADVDDELRFHLETKVQELVRRGLPKERARAEALRQFGNVAEFRRLCERLGKEREGTVRRIEYWSGWAQDLRYALRTLCKSPGFTSVAVLTLALGIGATTVGFSVVYNLVLEPFAYRAADRLMTPTIRDLKQPANQRAGYSVPEFLDLRTQNHVFEDMVVSYDLDVLYTTASETEVFLGAYVTTNTFEFFGMPPLLGRGIAAEDGEPGAPRVFVMNYRLWKERFNGDPNILGTSMILNGERRTLVGIMPPRFQAYGVRIWLPLGLSPGVEGSTAPNGLLVYLWAIGRLKPGVSLRSATADLSVIANRLSKIYPTDYPQQFAVVIKGINDFVMGNFQVTLYTMLAAVFMLLLIA